MQLILQVTAAACHMKDTYSKSTAAIISRTIIAMFFRYAYVGPYTYGLSHTHIGIPYEQTRMGQHTHIGQDSYTNYFKNRQ